MNKEIKKKQIAILGSTGSIGTQALQAVSYTHLSGFQWLKGFAMGVIYH